ANSTVPFTPDAEPRRHGPPNTIYECWKCARLVETQFHLERPIVPRFCPWCGKPPSSILGREIDGYRIDEVISRGGFGIIYLASNVAQPAMKAAIKFLRPEMAYYRPELVKIFIEEARLTEAIGQTCWNIVRLSNVRERPWPYYFMEYIRGPTLEELIECQRPQRLPLRDCIGFLRGIAKALAVTHSHGRIHRDLKPLNIMIIRAQEIAQPEERVKLLDFGLAMKIAHRRRPDHSGASASGLTTGESDSLVQVAGTPEYMPPESFDGINEFAGDIYSLGVAAYEILTSQRPWKDPSAETERFSYWRDCHMKKAPRPVRELRPEVPKWLARVVADCLEKDPRKRIAETEQLIRRLREPASLWLKLSGAAAALVFAVLLWLVLAGGKTKETLRWNLPSGSPAVVYASSETDLRARQVVASLSSKKVITSCSTSLPDAVDCAVEGRGDIALRFKPGAGGPLLGRTIEVRGGGSGFFFEDAVRFEEDKDPPRFERLRH
ncbi:MAG: serine/threonine protein kinase, partial [Thermoanaerobaculia bacterium]